MGYDEVRDAILNMTANDQKRLIMEVIPQVWDRACDDVTCALKLKKLVDQEIMRPYDDIYTGGI